MPPQHGRGRDVLAGTGPMGVHTRTHTRVPRHTHEEDSLGRDRWRRVDSRHKAQPLTVLLLSSLWTRASRDCPVERTWLARRGPGKLTSTEPTRGRGMARVESQPWDVAGTCSPLQTRKRRREEAEQFGHVTQ